MVFFKDFIYLRERERETANGCGVGTQGEGEADSLLSKEPDVGLDLRTWDHDLN